MDHRGDGYFQIINLNQTNGLNVLDSQNGASGGAVVQNPQSYSTEAITGNANQEWDIQSAGNCGDIPANCANPPLTATGNYYTIINKATGMLLTANGTGANATIVLQPPAAASNGDFTVPANKGQLWQIVPVHITGRALYPFTGFQSPVANPAHGELRKCRPGDSDQVQPGRQPGAWCDRSRLSHRDASRLQEPGRRSGAQWKRQQPVTARLSYDPSNTYTYVWKTTRAWRARVRMFTLLLIDGSDHIAYFQFR